MPSFPVSRVGWTPQSGALDGQALFEGDHFDKRDSGGQRRLSLQPKLNSWVCPRPNSLGNSLLRAKAQPTVSGSPLKRIRVPEAVVAKRPRREVVPTSHPLKVEEVAVTKAQAGAAAVAEEVKRRTLIAHKIPPNPVPNLMQKDRYKCV